MDFPDSIQLGGGGPDPSGGGADPSGRGAPHGPARGDHSDSLNEVVALLDEYISGETDETDIATAREIQAKVQKLRASQQDLVDKATGAGPGARLMRKAGPGGGSY